METIDFIDPDYKKKKKYNNHLKALIKMKDQIEKHELALVSEFFERKLLNKRVKDNRVFLLNVAGSIRTLFRIFEFQKVTQDLKEVGIELTVPQKHLNKIRNEYNRRNRKSKQNFKRSKTAVQVEYKKRSKNV